MKRERSTVGEQNLLKKEPSQPSIAGEADCQIDLSEDYLMKNYQGGSRYSLSHINSILFREGKIYNLLEKNNLRRAIKCGCVKSNCQANYCECYRWGMVCGQDCFCVGCRNRGTKKRVLTKVHENGCNCVKSSCNKKYCQCYQNGLKCTNHCKCSNCLNII